MSDTGLRVRGFSRVTIEEDGKIVGDSGYNENQVVNLGFNWYLAGALGSIAGSSYVDYMALGTGAAPGATATTLGSEVEKRTSVTAATSSDSKAVRFTATFTSAQSFVTKTEPISSIGLFQSLTVGTIFSGNDYASSNVATNQNVNCTYDISFS